MSTDAESKPEGTNLSLAVPTISGPSPAGPAGRGETIAKVGTLVSAVMASSCCWLPLVLLAVGVSGAGIASALAAYRPLFMVVTFAFLGTAFYFTYRPRRVAVQADCCAVPVSELDCCGRPIVKQADCCSAPTVVTRPRFNMMALNKVMLWVVTALAVAFLFFPGYVADLFGARGETITKDMHRSVLKVEGMWCEGCAPVAAKAIRKAPGVLAVEVDYSSGLATIGTNPAQSVPKQTILGSLKSIGFDGEFVEE